MQTPHWKEALKILKLAVTRSSTLVAPASGSSSGSVSFHWEATGPGAGANFAEAELYMKKELPGEVLRKIIKIDG